MNLRNSFPHIRDKASQGRKKRFHKTFAPLMFNFLLRLMRFDDIGLLRSVIKMLFAALRSTIKSMCSVETKGKR